MFKKFSFNIITRLGAKVFVYEAVYLISEVILYSSTTNKL